jgi:ATP-dependent Clp protease protease subunit
MDKKTQEQFSELLKKKIIPIFGEVNQEMLDIVKTAFIDFYLHKVEEIFVIISSGGGKTHCAFEIFDLLKLYPGNIIGIVVGRGLSAAATILQGCSVRLATPNSRILIHNGDNGIDADTVLDENSLKEYVEDYHRLRKRVWTIISNRTGHSIDEVKAEFTRNKEMDVEQAIMFKLLDGVYDKPLPWNLAGEFKV